jgi:hypothetical protein
MLNAVNKAVKFDQFIAIERERKRLSPFIAKYGPSLSLSIAMNWSI